MQLNDRIYVAGHGGLVGSALVRRLRALGYENLILRTHRDLDLRDVSAARAFFDSERPQYVFLAAARVGGIRANIEYPADFIRDNLLVQCNAIESARAVGVEKLLFLGSSCIYPRNAPQPLREEYLLSGPLEPTNAPYAVAKIAGIVMCQSYNRQYGTRFMSVMPTNLYGEGDNFNLSTAHVLPALLRRFHEAKLASEGEVVVWGSGRPRREFLHVDDMADACVHLMNTWAEGEPAGAGVGGADAIDQFVNIGYGEDVSIRELAELIQRVVGFTGRLAFDQSKPDGMPRKLLDSSRLQVTGWQRRISLQEGVERTYAWLTEHYASARL